MYFLYQTQDIDTAIKGRGKLLAMTSKHAVMDREVSLAQPYNDGQVLPYLSVVKIVASPAKTQKAKEVLAIYKIDGKTPQKLSKDGLGPFNV